MPTTCKGRLPNNALSTMSKIKGKKSKVKGHLLRGGLL